ncbi:dihydrolipoyl dehydrogenase [Parvularcula sp. LCG005]|uniref:dihydrolipoyl dehydrogenase n=1 Tax=Parvularcula sp. LCG005 TaxID=3078805 RepID=UPI00397B4125
MNVNTLIIGGGPGGYVAGIRAGQLGIDTLLVDSQPMGGTCLNVGCIPSKALIHAADEFAGIAAQAEKSALGITVQRPSIDLAATIGWKDGIVKRLNGGVAGLLKKAGTITLSGWVTLQDGKSAKVTTTDGEILVKARHLILATGSVPQAIPAIPFGPDVWSSTDALSCTAVPKSLAIIGGGYIGLELGTAFAKLGCAVTIVEATGKILPQYDDDLTAPVHKRLKSLGMTVLLDTRATSFSAGKLSVETAEASQDISAEKVLVTVGRRPRTEGFGLDGLDLEMTGPFVRVDDRCRTSMSGVYAIGDLTGNPMLAHRAMAQGEMVAEILAGHPARWDRRAIPEICFTDPEIVQVGLSAAAAKAEGYDVVTGKFPMAANGRSMTTEDEAGFVQAIARADNHLLVGLQAVGRDVSELSAGFTLALEMGARLEDIAGTIHAHPTRSEGLQEAALTALGKALHF